ncbi:MAG: hypothetical protein ACFE9L_05350 [Candidatus Hodarchaeota archaeon]
MDDDRDENELFLEGDINNINSIAYNGIERPLDLTIQTEDTPKGWYRGGKTYDYDLSTPYSSVYDNDWDTPGMSLDVGVNSTIDIELVGSITNYNNPSYDKWIPGGYYLDNNGWIMFDLGDTIPKNRQW